MTTTRQTLMVIIIMIVIMYPRATRAQCVQPDMPTVNGQSGAPAAEVTMNVNAPFNQDILTIPAGIRYRLKVSGTFTVWRNNPSLHCLDAFGRYADRFTGSPITPISGSPWRLNGTAIAPSSFNPSHVYWIQNVSTGNETFSFTDQNYNDNNGLLQFELYLEPDVIEVCRSNGSTDLSEYVIGQNLRWYTSASGGSGTTSTPVINNNTSGLITYWVTQTISNCESDRSPIYFEVTSDDCPFENLISEDDITICSGETLTITATGIESATWSGTASFTQVNDSTISASPSSDAIYRVVNRVKDEEYLINTSFETPDLNAYAQVDASTVPGWNTTAGDNRIEVWQDGFLGVPAYEGTQFVELNANEIAALYQDVVVTPGTELVWQFAHRGRNDVDDMHFEVGPPGGPYELIGTYSDGPGAWVVYTGTYIIPVGQNTTRFYFTSASGTSSGNLLDGIEFYTFIESRDSMNITVENCQVAEITEDTILICPGETATIEAINVNSEVWSGTGPFTVLNASRIEVSPTTTATYYIGDSTGYRRTGNNIIVNGNFENGATGFTSQYSEDCVGQMSQGAYCVGTNPQTYNFRFSSCGDHTSGNGNMFVTDAATVANTNVWCQNVNVTPNTDYEFSAWVATVYSPNNAAVLEFNIDGIPLGSRLNAGTECNWLNYAATWNSGNRTSAEICLVNQNTAGGGNDFALDDIEFVPIEYTLENLRDSVVVMVGDLPEIDLGADTTICDIDSLELRATHLGFIYDWSTGANTPSITVDETGEYAVTVRDELGCENSDTINISVQNRLHVNLRADTVICFGDVLILDAGNSTLAHAWSTNETTQTIEVSSADVYSVIVTDALGCTGFDVFELKVNELPNVSLSGPSDVCLRSGLAALTESPTGGLFTGQAITTSGFYDPTTAGLIPDQASWAYYTYTDENNCTSRDSTAITLRLEPDPIIGMPDTIVCEGETTTLFVSSTNPAIFEWFDLGTNNGIANGNSYGSTTGGTYYVHATNAYCSAYSDTVLVELVTPVLELTTDMLEETILEGESVTITAQSPNVVGFTYSYEWLEYSTGNQTSGPSWTVSPEDSTYYLVTATLRGCPVEAEILIGVTQRIKMPDAFTPNGDGINDEFLIGNIEDYPAAQVTIYNRWGNILHETFAGSYKSEPWNGMASGQELPVGVYYYTVNPNDERVEPLSGNIQLLK